MCFPHGTALALPLGEEDGANGKGGPCSRLVSLPCGPRWDCLLLLKYLLFEVPGNSGCTFLMIAFVIVVLWNMYIISPHTSCSWTTDGIMVCTCYKTGYCHFSLVSLGTSSFILYIVSQKSSFYCLHFEPFAWTWKSLSNHDSTREFYMKNEISKASLVHPQQPGTRQLE